MKNEFIKILKTFIINDYVRENFNSDLTFTVPQIIEAMAKAYNLDHPTPSADTKSAKQILRQHLHGFSDEQFEKELSHFPLCEVITAMERYNAQFEVSGETKSAEELLKKSFTPNYIERMWTMDDTIKAMLAYHAQFEAGEWIENIISHLSDKIEPGADSQNFGSEYTKGRNDAFRLVINLLKKHLPQSPKNQKP